jgi:serine/threonine protein phosphatase PrpC
MLFAQIDMSAPESFQLVSGEVLVFTHDKNGVLVIADGLGGLPGGSTASSIAVSRLSKTIEKAALEQTPLREAILDGIERANRDILATGSGAATTIASVEIQHDRMRPYHIGDSMILLCGQRGKQKLLSVAHSPVGYAVESGMLDVDEAVHHEERHIVSNVVGAPDMRIEIGAARRIAKRDTLILASDGLFDNLYLDEIVEIIRKGDLQSTSIQLLELTRERMSQAKTELPNHPDDLTFILYRRNPDVR